MVVLWVLFTFGQLGGSEEEYERNTQSFHFWLAVYLALGLLVTAIYIMALKLRPSRSNIVVA